MKEAIQNQPVRFKFIKTSDPEYGEERMLRWEILRKPLGLPPGSELMPEDKESFHLVALCKKAVIGCVLFHPENASSGRVFQFALSEEHSGRGIGRKLFHTLEEFLIKSGYTQVYCYAREEAEEFYQNLGFFKEGGVTIHNNVPHLLMRKTLKPST